MNTQTPSRWPELLFYFLAVAGLIGTNAQLPAYIQADFMAGNIAFWKDTVATPAATFIFTDIAVVGTAVFAFMFAECRRLGIHMKWAWTYLAVGVFIGFCVAIPLFFAHRQRRLCSTSPEQAVAPQGADLIAIGLLLATTLYIVAYSLRHIPG